MHVTNIKGSLITAIAGGFVLASVVLGYLVHPYFFAFAGWVGFMLVFASLTGLCPMYWILKKLGFKEGPEGVDGVESNCCRAGA